MQFSREPELIIALKAGESGAVTTWYQSSKHALLQFFLKRMSNEPDAQELVHDTYLSCLASLPLFRGESGLWTFMLSIARHELADYWRKRYAKKAIALLPYGSELLGSLEEKAGPLEESRVKEQEIGEIQELLARLPHDISEMLQLKYVDGLSVRELATHYELSLAAMQSRLYRAKEVFKEEYEEMYRSGD